VKKQNIRIEEFKPKESSKELLESYIDFSERIFIELYPDDDPSYERETIRQEILNIFELLDYYFWILILEENSKQTVIGKCSFYISNKKNPNYEENKHTTWFQLFIDKQYRRQGWGTKLFQVMIKKIVELKEITIVQTYSLLDSGWRFCEKNGAVLALVGVYNRLKLADVDWQEMANWVKDGENLAQKDNCSLEIFDHIPDTIIDEFTKFFTDIANLVPLGELDDIRAETPESRRIREEQFKKLGIKWITMITKENDGSISGITDIQYSQSKPYLIEQDVTGVLPKYRGRGLGKWLKAAMLFYIQDKFPKVTIINTGNADTNAPMLSINERMGYKKHLTEKCYKFQLQDLMEKFGINR